MKKIDPSVFMSMLSCLLLTGCGTTATYNVPFSEARATLLESLSLAPGAMSSSFDWGQAQAVASLKDVMSMKLYAVDVHDDWPGEELSFTCHHFYDIGAVGGEYIRFDLAKKDSKTTRITVDYSDRWYGIWPPFLFWNPGIFRETTIHRVIWGNANNPAHATGKPAPGR